ncbi:transcriptional regulator, ArsR family [Jatrophihabitans endophyticus]|uniref:Transcriptional regulator, ArsR family n=1 Tax=Jatrophihabitans endophyticus TaxID=1206085 RepID=A0A1M5DPP8_9ACTN|nr:metalloregulator ArsR/SmtB family transcription factor [Jatrophihabitans endophyticus]SHF68940.1 transcriptional regulator, ArsR family [Jatrophihabitans endophyticus]
MWQAGAVWDSDAAVELARRCKALGDPTRVRLLSLLVGAGDDGACICDLTGPVGLTQPTVSHHMKQLAAAGLVTREQRGRWAYYALVPDAFTGLAAALTACTPVTASNSSFDASSVPGAAV